MSAKQTDLSEECRKSILGFPVRIRKRRLFGSHPSIYFVYGSFTLGGIDLRHLFFLLSTLKSKRHSFRTSQFEYSVYYFRFISHIGSSNNLYLCLHCAVITTSITTSCTYWNKLQLKVEGLSSRILDSIETACNMLFEHKKYPLPSFQNAFSPIIPGMHPFLSCWVEPQAFKDVIKLFLAKKRGEKILRGRPNRTGLSVQLVMT